MKVSVAFGELEVLVAGASDGLDLYLVAHFLGLATHDNNNMEPSRVRHARSPAMADKHHGSAVPDLHRATEQMTDERFYEGNNRAMDDLLSRRRLKTPSVSPVSRVFEELHCPSG